MTGTDDEPDGMLKYLQVISDPQAHRDDPNWPLPSFDARDWAQAFCERYPQMDQDVMLAWFANALMRGYDQARMPNHDDP
jgi:hypothetical protein